MFSPKITGRAYYYEIYSYLKAVEILACPALRPPAMVSEINSGGILERRLTMIVSTNRKQSNLLWLQVCILLCAFVVLPMGLTYAQDHDAGITKIRATAATGEMTRKEAGEMSQEDDERRSAAASRDSQSSITNRRLLTYLFRQVDLDKSESLSLNEINAALNAGNERITWLLTGLQKFFQSFDDDGDNELSRTECFGIMKRIEEREKARRTQRILKYLFAQVDMDKSESLSLWEINTALNVGNERIAWLLTGLLEYFERIDRNGDGELSKRETYRAITRLEEREKAGETERLLTYLFEQVDLDQSEGLLLSEIDNALASGNERITRLLTGLKQYFERIDQNSDGELSKRECYGFVIRLGEREIAKIRNTVRRKINRRK